MKNKNYHKQNGIKGGYAQMSINPKVEVKKINEENPFVVIRTLLSQGSVWNCYSDLL